jgi:hypothetical protein
LRHTKNDNLGKSLSTSQVGEDGFFWPDNRPEEGEGNEVQEAVQPHNQKDHACQISGDYGSGFHNRILLFDLLLHWRSNILISIELMMIYFWEIQVFYDPRQSRDGPRLVSNDEGDARPDKVRNRRY